MNEKIKNKMTKNIFMTIILTAGILAGCQNKTSFTINGSIADSAYDGTYVYLQEPEDTAIINIDSALISNGRFTFKGNAEKPLLVQASLNVTTVEPRSELSRLVLIEPGTITLLFDTVITVSGTPTNEDFSKFKAKERICLTRFITLMDEYDKRQSEGTLLKEYEKDFEKEYKKTTDELAQYNVEFISKHPHTDLAKKILSDKIKIFTPEQQRELLEKTDDEFRKIPQIAALIKELNEPEKAPVGSQFIDLHMTDDKGKNVALSDYVGKGKIVLLDFWASWCLPCVNSLPHLKELFAAYKNKGFDIVGISLDDKSDAWKKAIKQHQIPWHNISELSIKNKGAEAYGVKGIPLVILIDKEGMIIAKNPNKEDLETLLKELIIHP